MKITIVNNKKTQLRVFTRLTGVSDTSLGEKLGISTTQVRRVINLHDPSPKVRKEIIRSYELPDDFFTGEYEMTVTLTKKETQAAQG